MPRTAKLFQNGRSQAVRLPAEFRFDATEVYIRKDEETGDVILSRRPETWDDFFDLVRETNLPADFMADRGDTPPQRRRLLR